MQDSGDLYSSGVKSRSELDKQFSQAALQVMRENFAEG